MKKIASMAILFSFLSGLLLSLAPPPTRGYAQVDQPETTASEKALQLFDAMTPAERVGQLFLVSFVGTNVDSNSKIFDLIMNRHIGGVILLRENNNFIGPDNTADETMDLISNLQQIEWYSANPNSLDSIPPTTQEFNYIPLFVAVSQEGDGYPNDQILYGLTPLPNLMAIGATWSPDRSRSIGDVLGNELSILGVNMLLGPSLDVLDLDYSAGKEALGTRSFGGNAYWVGNLGKAYIDGVHHGSEGKVLVISKHFPGRGSADRNPNNEVATVRKPYELLLNDDLAPFLTVTRDDENGAGITDGLLTAHIRYEGLQGTIRNTTRPISFDVTALEQLFAIPTLSQWRQSGGIVVSDNLGSQAVRRFYDPNGTNFDARQIARNAVNAGIDLLYLDNFVATGDIDQYTTVVRTLEFFLQKYMEDEAFAQRVDSSVKRLLEKKFTLYPDFQLENVLPAKENLDSLNLANPVTFELAQESITLLHPPAEDLAIAIPNPPGLSDRTVFFTELRLYNQCSNCPEIEMIPSDALRKSVIRLYGPQAGGDIAQYLLSTFSFNDLTNMLNGSEEARVVEEELRAATWVVFAFMDTDPDRPASLALKRLLSERPELLVNKYSVAFAFNAPYLMDATEISDLSAYFAVYSKIPTFTEIATRVLFQEIFPSGSPPISLPAIGYDLDVATSPNSTQNISLMLDFSFLETLNEQETAPAVVDTREPMQNPSFETGDTLPLVTGVIFDRNNNPVPDGTVVHFLFTMEGQNNFTQQINSTTVDGIARAEYLIQNEGRLEISVTSGEAVNSDKLALNITEGQAAVITVIVPTSTPTVTATFTPTISTPTPTSTATETPLPPEPIKTSGGDWLLSMALVWSISIGIFILGRSLVNLRWAIRWSLLAAIGGMLSYIYLSLRIAGNQNLLRFGGFAGIAIALLMGMATGWLCGWVWYRNRLNRKKRT